MVTVGHRPSGELDRLGRLARAVQHLEPAGRLVEVENLAIRMGSGAPCRRRSGTRRTRIWCGDTGPVEGHVREEAEGEG